MSETRALETTNGSPIQPFPNGRNAAGRFTAGNAGGPGNPYTRRAAEFRAAFLDAVTGDDLRAIVQSIVEAAKAGDVVAAREVLNRTIGKAPAFGELAEAIPQQESKPMQIKIEFDDEG